MSSERASWMDQDATQACSTTRWVDGGVSRPRKERSPKLRHVPLTASRLAHDAFCVCLRHFLVGDMDVLAWNLKTSVVSCCHVKVLA